jgi:hypothetical protein
MIQSFDELLTQKSSFLFRNSQHWCQLLWFAMQSRVLQIILALCAHTMPLKRYTQPLAGLVSRISDAKQKQIADLTDTLR